MFVYVTCAYSVFFTLLISQHWSKLQTSGKWPPPRNEHAACCIVGDHPQVMVVGGYGGCALSDVWLLDVTNGSWSEVLHVYAHVHGVYMYTKKISASALNLTSSANS